MMTKPLPPVSIVAFMVMMLTCLWGQQILINEFLTANTSTNPDIVDFDDFTDWIELYNPTDSDIDLTDYYLTDNLSNPTRWPFPPGYILPAQDYLLIWADGWDDIPGNTYTRPYWPWDYYTTQRLHSNFKLSRDGEQIGLFQAWGTNSQILISQGDDWQYLDDGSNLYQAWTQPEYNADLWEEGPAELGYGDGDENTVVSYGPDSGDKYITTYFRNDFQVTGADSFQNLLLRLIVDDGAIVYLNGDEIYRFNLPPGMITFDTPAMDTVGGTDESEFLEHMLDTGSLFEGLNTLAVEIHQANPTSSDISFDFEFLGITHAAVSVVDTLTYDEQYADVSQGLASPLADIWAWYNDPTPGEANNTPAIFSTAAGITTQFSLAAGWYTGSQSLVLSTSSPDAVIRCTMDGSKPTFNSPVCEGEISLTSTTVVRARAYEPGQLSGPVVTNTYFIDESEHHLPIVAYTAEPSFLFGNELGIYSNEFKQREIPVHVEFFETESTRDYYFDGGSRLGGYNIFRFAQKPLILYSRTRYGQDELHYPFIPGNVSNYYEQLILRNSGDDWPGALLRDPLSPSLVGDKLLNIAQAYRPVALFINGEYWGISNIRERFDERYFYNHFGIEPGNVDHLEYQRNANGSSHMAATDGDLVHYNAMLDFLRNNDLSTPENYATVNEFLAVDSFIDQLCLQTFSGNPSWNHNEELWRPRTPDGRWQWICVDQDRSFQMSLVTANIVNQMSNDYEIFQLLLQNDQFHSRFVQRSAAHINSTFAAERIIAIVDSLQNNIAAELPNHVARWSDEEGIPSVAEWESSVEEIRQFSLERTAIVRIQLNTMAGSPGWSTIDISPSGDGEISVTDVPLSADLNSAWFYQQHPLEIQALPSPGFVFNGWGDGNSSPTINIVLNQDTTLTPIFSSIPGTVLPGSISETTTLTAVGSPYICPGDLIVEPGVSLTIDPGVTLRFANSGNMIIRGDLQCMGTVEAPIQMVPDTLSGALRWGALCLEETSGASLLQYVHIRGATQGPDPDRFPGAISAYDSDLMMDGILIENVDFPVFTQYGSTILQNSHIRQALGTCDYINVKYGYGEVDNCRFEGINAFDTDAIDFDGVVGGFITNNRIWNFTGDNSDGIDLGEGCIDLLIDNNRIYHCFDKGISVGQQSSGESRHNLIVGCGQGVGVKDSLATLLVNGTTFFGNMISVASFEKNPGAGGGQVEVVNSILSNSIEQTFMVDDESILQIRFSLSDTEELAGINNVLIDPYFMDAENYNFQLAPDSPAIDSGDPTLPLDPDGTLPDIGGNITYDPQDYPFLIPGNRVIINEINYQSGLEYPAGDWVELLNHSDEPVDLTGWRFKDSDDLHLFIFPSGLIILPDSMLVICRDTTDFRSVFPYVQLILGEFDFGLSSNGELIRLINDENLVEDALLYGSDPPWPIEPNGTGATLELINHELNNGFWSNWTASPPPGSPGEVNFGEADCDPPSGDATEDGEVNILDVVAIISHIMGTGTLPGDDPLCHTDLNQDGELNVLDIIILVDWIING